LVGTAALALSCCQVEAQTSAARAGGEQNRVAARVLDTVDDTNRTMLRGNVHPMARPQFDRGAVADAQPLTRILLLLQRSAEQEDSLPVPALATLRFVVAEYSHEMRTLGHYPEKVLVALKSAVRDVGTPIGLKPMVDALVTAAAQWCITAYFDAPSMETVVDEQDR